MYIYVYMHIGIWVSIYVYGNGKQICILVCMYICLSDQ